MNYHKAQLLQMISQNSLEENNIKDTPGDDRTMEMIQAKANLIDKNIGPLMYHHIIQMEESQFQNWK